MAKMAAMVDGTVHHHEISPARADSITHTAPATELASQYINQVTSDLERNVKEQERISAEIAALQEQLGVLQRDHSVLVNMQEALGIAAIPPTGVPG